MKSEVKKSSATRGQVSESILINQTRIFLNFETQTSKLGRPFRLSGTRQNLQQPQKWIDAHKMFMHHYFHTFKYLDEQGGFFEIECDYENKYINKSLKKL